jgi:hypothetical protein
MFAEAAEAASLVGLEIPVAAADIVVDTAVAVVADTVVDTAVAVVADTVVAAVAGTAAVGAVGTEAAAGPLEAQSAEDHYCKSIPKQSAGCPVEH